MPLDGYVRLVCRVDSVVLKRSCRECAARSEDQAIACEVRVEICVSADVGPNITGGFNANNGAYDIWSNYFFADGAFSCNGFTDPDRRGNAGGSGGGGRITVSASRVSSAYGKSSTVQVASLRIMPCIKL